MSKINHIHLYRNGVVLDNREAAESRLKEFASGNTYTDLDGVAILARYKSAKNTNDILTLVGIMYEDQSGAKSITIIDVEDLKSDAKVEVDALKKAVDDLKGNPSTSTSGDTSVEGAKRYTDGKIAELDVTDAAVENQYVSSVSETDGRITVSRTAIPIIGVTDSKENGKFVTSIKLEGNTVQAERAQITSSQVSRVATDITGVTVEDALKEVKDRSIVSLSSTTPSDGTSSVLKKYTLTQNGEKIGDIDIPKDLVVTSGSVVKGTWSGNVFTEVESGKGTALKLVIANQTEPVYINTLDLVKDHVGGNGISISDKNEISIKIADGNEGDFLKLDAEGLKLVGVGDAIKKSATVVEKKSGDAHITVESRTETSGNVVYTIGSVNIASADSITAETETRKTIEGQSGDTYTANTGATYISGATSLNDADVKLDEAIKNLSSSVGKATILAGNGISVDNTPTNGTKVSVKLDNNGTAHGSGLELTENGLSINLSEITLDCGTY